MELIVKAGSFEELRKALEELTQMKHEEKAPEVKPQAEVIPPATRQAEPPAESTPAPVKTSIETVRKALTNLIDLKGRTAVRDILKKHNVARVTELKPEDFDAVIEEAANAAK